MVLSDRGEGSASASQPSKQSLAEMSAPGPVATNTESSTAKEAAAEDKAPTLSKEAKAAAAKERFLARKRKAPA